MELFRRSQFLVSPPAILKIVEMVVLVTGLVMFLAGNKCGNETSFLTLYVLPVGVCAGLTLVSYVSAILVFMGGRDPLTIPTWVKGEVWFNVAALVVMLTGSVITLTNKGCADRPLIVTAIALGFISAVLFASSGATTYLLLVRQQEAKEAKQATIQSHRITHIELS